MSAAAGRHRATGAGAALRATPAAARHLLAGVVVNQMGAFVQMYLVLYLVHAGGGVQVAGLALSAYSAGTVVGMLLGGELTHRLGSRATIALSMAASAVLLTSVPLAGVPGREAALLPVVAGAGAMSQAARPAATTLLVDLMPAEHRVLAFSLYRIALNLGAVAGPLLATVLVGVDWNLLFVVDGLTSLGYAALALRALPTGTPAPRDAQPAPAVSRPAGYLALLRDSRFVLYLVAMALSAGIYMQFLAVLPLQLRGDGHPASWYSAILALSAGLVICCELVATTWVQRWPAGVAGGLGIGLLGAGLSMYALPGGAVTLVLGTVIEVTGQIIAGPTMFAHAARVTAGTRGRCVGASQAMFGLGTAAGPAIGVLAWSHAGRATWPACGVVGALAAAAAVAGLRESPRRRRAGGDAASDDARGARPPTAAPGATAPAAGGERSPA